MAFHTRYETALCFILLSAVFDFLDGTAARLLHAYSAIGKDLDSLADMVSFGLAPSAMLFVLLGEETMTGGWLAELFPYAAFLLAVFSGLRLAKFNNDTRQTSSFVGLPVPADALFWASLVVGIQSHHYSIAQPLYLLPLILFFAWLLVSEIPMFSLKIKSWTWKENRVRYLFLAGCVPLLVWLGACGFAAVIVWYILLSLFTPKRT
jgi:CDP-diacylglycerol--serine O-phosphatidyltransferase